MKGVKVACGVNAIIESIPVIFLGALLVVAGIVTSITDIIAGFLSFTKLDFTSDTVKIIFIAIGAFYAAAGFIYFIFGILFCKRNSGKGTAVMLLILSIPMLNSIVFTLSTVFLANGTGTDSSNSDSGGNKSGGKKRTQISETKDYSGDNVYV